MELFNNHILSECFVEGSETHQELKRMEKETSEDKADASLQSTLKTASLNNLREIMNKIKERELG
tara:strand:+ start:575 stop:769 length:195 start_codon:yes stop_codon:yes gene_type:complete